MTNPAEPLQNRPAPALRALLRELTRARREIGRFPGRNRLRTALVHDLDVVARALPSERPCVLQLDGREVRFANEILLRESDSQPLFRTLASAGASGILIAPPIAGEELLAFVELVLAAGGTSDVVERLRVADLPGIALIFTPIEGSSAGSSDARTAKKGLAGDAKVQLAEADMPLVRAALERDFGRNMPLAAASALLEASDDGKLGEAPPDLLAILTALLAKVLAQHEVHVALALLEETDRCRSLDDPAREALAKLLEASVDEAWVAAVAASHSQAEAAALGVLVLRCSQLLPLVLRCEATLQDPTFAHELELIARLNPEPFANSAGAADARERAAARELLKRAGHSFGDPDAPRH